MGPLVKRYSPFAENVTAHTLLPTLISVAEFNDQHQCALHLVSTHWSLLTTYVSATQSSNVRIFEWWESMNKLWSVWYTRLAVHTFHHLVFLALVHAGCFPTEESSSQPSITSLRLNDKWYKSQHACSPALAPMLILTGHILATGVKDRSPCLINLSKEEYAPLMCCARCHVRTDA